MIPYQTFLQAVHKIALVKPNLESQRKFTGKRPHISFKENPKDYRGLRDANYGTGFETTYIKPFDSFFAVLDIDDYKNSEYDILSAIPDKARNTHQAKTQSGGLHLYFLSKEPLKLVQNLSVPMDLKCIRETSYNDGKYGGLIVGDYCWKQYNRSWGVDYVKKFYTHNNKPLLEVDINNVVEKIYKNLGLEAKTIAVHKPKSKNKIKYRGDADLKELYTIIYRIFENNLNSKYDISYRLNCRLHMLSDKERQTLADWIVADFGEYMEDIDKFYNEFTKRK